MRYFWDRIERVRQRKSAYTVHTHTSMPYILRQPSENNNRPNRAAITTEQWTSVCTYKHWVGVFLLNMLCYLSWFDVECWCWCCCCLLCRWCHHCCYCCRCCSCYYGTRYDMRWTIYVHARRIYIYIYCTVHAPVRANQPTIHSIAAHTCHKIEYVKALMI